MEHEDQLDAALARVEALVAHQHGPDDEPASLGEHADAFENVHEILQRRLDAADG